MKPYSKDLRERVIVDVKSGCKYEDVAKKYKVSYSVVGRWYRRYKREGNYEARKYPGAKRKIDLKLLEQYVESHPDMTLSQAASYFKVTMAAISYRLKKIGCSYKKNAYLCAKQMKKSEQSS